MAARTSVIIPAHNAASYLEEAVGSVLAQTDGNLEAIVVDDGSSDATPDLIAELGNADPRVRSIRLDESLGAAGARNAGIDLAEGRFIAFLDSDDAWEPTKLERQLAFMEHGGIPFSFTSYRRVGESGRPLGVVRAPNRLTYKDLLKSSPIGCLTAVMDTRVTGKLHMPNIRRRQDLGLWLRLVRETGPARGLDEVLATYRVRASSLSSCKFVAAAYQWKLYREIEKVPLLAAGYYFTHYLTRGLTRRVRYQLESR